jgi:hypothetical protein
VRRWADNSGDDAVLTLRADGRGDSKRLLAVGGEPGDA